MGYATCATSTIGVGAVTFIDPTLTTKAPAVGTILALLLLSILAIAMSRTNLSIRGALILNSMAALTVIFHVEILLTIHPGHEPPKLLLPLLIPIMAMCLPLTPRELIPPATALLIIHGLFAPLTQPEFIDIELILLSISIFFAYLSVKLGDQDRRQLAISQVATLREQALLEQANTTLEQRIAERTKVAEERTQELKSLSLELNRAEQRERQAIARTLHDDLQQVLAAVRLRLAAIIPNAQEDDQTENETHLDSAQTLLLEALEMSRSLSVQLAPYALLDHGLSTALGWLGRQFEERYQLEVHAHLDEAANPENNEVATFLFNAARELLFNVVKHADTQEAHLKLTLTEVGEPLLQVYNSQNVEANTIPVSDEKGAAPLTFGLPTMQRRIDLMDGKMTVTSDSSGVFSVTLQLPSSL